MAVLKKHTPLFLTVMISISAIGWSYHDIKNRSLTATTNKYYKLSKKLTSNKQYDKAIVCLDKLIFHCPKCIQGYYEKGTVYYLQGKYLNAIEEYTKTIKLNPKHYMAYFNRGMAYSNLGDYEKAISDFTYSLEIFPRYTNALERRSQVFCRFNRDEEAIADLNNAIQIFPSKISCYVLRADILFKKDRLKEAFQDYNIALKLNPKYYKAYLGNASLYLTFADFENAEKSIKSALTINPGSPNAIRKQLEIQSIKKNVISLCQIGLKCLSDQRYRFAVEHFDKALKLAPNASTLFLYRATAYAATNDSKAALEDVSMAIKLTQVHHIKKQPELFELLNQRGVYYAKEKQTALAIKDFNSSIAFNNHFAESYNNRGVLFYLQRDMEKACPDLERACDLGMCVYYNKALENGFCKKTDAGL